MKISRKDDYASTYEIQHNATYGVILVFSRCCSFLSYYWRRLLAPSL